MFKFNLIIVLFLLVFLVSGCASVDNDAQKNEMTTKPVVETEISPAKSSDLIGDWKVIKAQTYFDDIEFIEDGGYIMHLPEKPLDTGEWSLSDDTVLTLVSYTGEEMNSVFTKVKIGGEKLYLNQGVVPIVLQKHE